MNLHSTRKPDFKRLDDYVSIEAEKQAGKCVATTTTT